MSDNNNNNNQQPPPKKKNPPPQPSQVKRKKKKGPAAAVKIPQGKHTFLHCTYTLSLSDMIPPFIPHVVFPTAKCKLRLLKLERVKDYLLMEQEFIQNQEVKRPREEQHDVSVFHFFFVGCLLNVGLLEMTE